MKEEMPERCISCGITLTGVGGARFPCPSCGTVIARCSKCKKPSNVGMWKARGFTRTRRERSGRRSSKNEGYA
mgnify:CR=1 FL=1